MTGGSLNGASDRELIAACIELAGRARGATSPNPLVGAVVVNRGEVVAQAYHECAGRQHAERLALAEAGESARGATLYVNMEPCAHHGRTPPCVGAIVEAGVVKVVASMEDPDSRVDGHGFDNLRAAGVEVEVGLLRSEAAELNAAYLKTKRDGRPLVVAKAALSLDGRLATRAGSSQWITGPEARARGHDLRASSDLVMVGVGTLLADDPRLTARDGAGAGPGYRGVVDSRLRTPVEARFLAEEQGQPLLITTEAAPGAARRRLEDAGARIVVVDADSSGRVELRAALAVMAELGINQVMIEGGSQLLTSAFELGIIDRVTLFYGPLLIGGLEAPALWGGSGSESIRDALRLRRVVTRQLGPDWAVEGWLWLPHELEKPGE